MCFFCIFVVASLLDMHTIRLNNSLLLSGQPIVMGIINITPDSFYISCHSMTEREVLSCAEKALQDGATILDVGGYSSRPGGKDISEEEEWRRVSAACGWIRRAFPSAILSVDTFRSDIARKAVNDYGVQMINDISGGELDENMFATIAELQVPYVLMHMCGTPQDMHLCPQYDNLLADMISYFEGKINRLHQMGVKDVILDPGFGFSKTMQQNYELLRKLHYLKTFNLPILVGVSRKSMIYKALDCSPQDALNGTTALNMLTLIQGANILRVHDVKQAVEVVQLYEHYKEF